MLLGANGVIAGTVCAGGASFQNHHTSITCAAGGPTRYPSTTPRRRCPQASPPRPSRRSPGCRAARHDMALHNDQTISRTNRSPSLVSPRARPGGRTAAAGGGSTSAPKVCSALGPCAVPSGAGRIRGRQPDHSAGAPDKVVGGAPEGQPPVAKPDGRPLRHVMQLALGPDSRRSRRCGAARTRSGPARGRFPAPGVAPSDGVRRATTGRHQIRLVASHVPW